MLTSSLRLTLILFSLSLTACSSFQPFSFFSSQSKTPPPSSMPVDEAAGKKSGTFITDEGSQVPVAEVAGSNQPLAGGLASGMDVIDRSNLTHALDNPLGKTAQWKNINTGVNYAATPTEKVTIKGNSLCRRYTMTAERGGMSRAITGIACISTDGNWHTVNGS